nr:MFS transporter [Haladaptatus cibarius]
MASLRKNQNFVRLFLGRLVTNVGDSLYLIAALWLVHELGGSPFLTGVAGFLTLLPGALQFLTGPFVDRWPLRRSLVVIQMIQAVCVLIIPLAAATGQLTVVLVLVLIPILSMLNQFVYPAQNAALPRIVEDGNIVRANSAFSFAYNGVDAAFNAIGGILIAVVGAVSLYVLDSITFVFAALLFASVNYPSTEAENEDTDESSISQYWSDLSEGFAYVRGSVVFSIITTAAIANFALQISTAVLPSFSDQQGGPEMYGAMLGALAAGTLLGSLVAPKLENREFGRVCIFVFFFGFVFWLGSIFSPWKYGTIGLFMLAWVPVGIFNVLVHATVQTIVPDELIGRAMSVTSGVSAAAGPVGALAGGAIASVWGSVVAMVVAAFGLLAVVGFFLVRPSLRQLPAITEIEGKGHAHASED